MKSHHFLVLSVTLFLVSVASADNFLYCDLFNERTDLIEKAPIIPPQGCGPEDASPNERVESMPNADGDILGSLAHRSYVCLCELRAKQFILCGL